MLLSVQSVFRPTSDLIQKRVSTAANGAEALGASFKPQFSPDGRYVAFESEAANLVAGDGNGSYDIFLKDLISGAITRIAMAGNTEANAGNFTPRFSPDGRSVLFQSAADNLVGRDENAATDIFLKELATGKITRLSMAGETEANDGSYNAQFSPDGRYILFQSAASNLVGRDENTETDIFLKELATGAITRLSTAGATEADGGSADARFSPDGRFVMFESFASNLVDGDSNGCSDIFLRDQNTGTITRISTAANGAQANNESYAAQFSPDGRYVLFESYASNLVAGDTNEAADIFLKDLATGAITRVSTAADGAQAKGGGSAPQFSPDGRYVLFESASSDLVAGDGNGRSDIFMKDLTTGAITCLSTAVNGALGQSHSSAAQFSADGRYVVFESLASNLVADDGNNRYDIFLVDLLYKANTTAILENRFIETVLGVGNASSASIAWGDGTSSSVTPTGGRAAFNHAYASTGVKAATVILTEGALTWSVAHNLDLGAGTMVRNTALADTLEGGAGRDSLTGDAFANILLGGGGNDVLSAGSGNDRLSGGRGQDKLTGGSGSDVFVFDDRETGASKTKADYILDFSRRQGDRIDLKAVDANTKKRGDQKFTFIGDDTSFSKAGQVRFEKTKGATYVYLNTDSDKAAEAVIKLKGALEVQKSWFVL